MKLSLWGWVQKSVMFKRSLIEEKRKVRWRIIARGREVTLDSGKATHHQCVSNLKQSRLAGHEGHFGRLEDENQGHLNPVILKVITSLVSK